MSEYKYTEKQLNNFNTVIEKILKKAQEDDKFRSLCLSDANKAFELATGQKWPEDASELKFSETECEDSIKLPKKDGELDEEDLDKVSGGIYICAPSKKFRIGFPEAWNNIEVTANMW